MKNKDIIFTILTLIIIIIIGIIACITMQNNKIDTKDNEKIQIEQTYAKLTDAYIYGTHLNIEGKIELNNKNIEKLTLLIINKEEQFEYNLKYEIKENEIIFTTCEYINKGIELEKITKEKNAIIIKAQENSKENKYYSINKNDINIEKLEYYSISKNNRTNYITLKELEKENSKYLIISAQNKEMPEEIYDITLDAGHGGNNPGAVYKGYYESNIVLDYTLKLKEKLEKQGLKVALTRDKDVKTDEYGENGRAVIPNKVKSKYTISIHLNSTEAKGLSGVEIYAPNKTDLSFANLLAKNIVEKANTIYSQNETDKVSEGVYVRTFTEKEIEESNKSAKRSGYKAYNITEETPYLFMIRETGAKITNAYVDGRNKEYKTNIYYNSSIGNESYLIELGYINSDIDLKNLLENKEGYLKALEESILNLVK